MEETRSDDRPVLVTGATGFTGGHLARELRRRGERVRVLVRPGADARDLAARGMELVEGRLTERADVRRAAAGTRAIYHIAAAYRTARQPDSYYRDVNVGGTEHVLEAARIEGVGRVVHCSTVGVHGSVDGDAADESAPFRPGDIYQQTKLEGELRAREAAERGLPVAIARPGAIYGPGDTRLLKLFRTVQNGTFRMFGPGRVRYHLVYVSDLVDGLILCGTRPEAVGGTFILAGPRSTPLNELVALVAAAVGVRPPRGRLPLWPLLGAAAACEALCRPLRIEPPLHRRRAEFFVKNRAFTVEHARRTLGYDPRVAPEEGLARTAAWYAEQGLLRPLESAPGAAVAGEGRAM